MDQIINQSYQLFLDLLFQIKDQEIQEIISYINKHSSSIEEEYKDLYKKYLHYICLYGEDIRVLKEELKIVGYKYCILESFIYYNDSKITIKTSYGLSIKDYIKEIIKTLNIEDQDYRYYISPDSYRRCKYYDYIYELDYYDFIEIYHNKQLIQVHLGGVYNV